MTTRILIADTHKMFREVLESLLGSRPDFMVVANTDDGEHLVAQVLDYAPDVLLTDVRLRKRSGIECIRDITAANPEVRSIVLTDEIAESEIIQAFLYGARGLVPKDAPTDLFFSSIRAVMDGEYWISHRCIAQLVQNLRSFATMVEHSAEIQERTLSHQQRHILDAITSGCSNREIARELGISERTVKYHLTRIFSKFGVSGRMELARYSIKNSLRRA